MSANKRKNVLLLALIFCCCAVTVGYFSLVNKAVIEGNIRFSQKEEGNWKIRFSNVETINEVGNAYNYQQPTLSNYMISFHVEFKEPGDMIEYEVEVFNEGTLDAELDNIFVKKNNSSYIGFKYSNIFVGEVLRAGEKKKFKVNIQYVTENTNLDLFDEKVQLVLNWKQAN